ncbi:hypothetical protein Nepgr_001079 [Nepenthes gracilis]|uniref:Uncharacterized protein n=1 Tax=Nepenthes gracilis TaxID=150966 RepID=A0AAD3RXG7_NEPGR|nr:hypothetical protein Nepgr_001079 [Nepenthes gracilis]
MTFILNYEANKVQQNEIGVTLKSEANKKKKELRIGQVARAMKNPEAQDSSKCCQFYPDLGHNKECITVQQVIESLIKEDPTNL